VGFHVADFRSPDVDFDEEADSSSSCGKYNRCGKCIADLDCGFCFLDVGGDRNYGAKNGSCVEME